MVTIPQCIKEALSTYGYVEILVQFQKCQLPILKIMLYHRSRYFSDPNIGAPLKTDV